MVEPDGVGQDQRSSNQMRRGGSSRRKSRPRHQCMEGCSQLLEQRYADQTAELVKDYDSRDEMLHHRFIDKSRGEGGSSRWFKPDLLLQ